ncbi:hypothetical protein bthur0003_55760 [Bacillus thuringiensis serovar thuringiensis str. T01001]|nr:hypothetical protein bthur0002_54580 [Bacillus thuringiensis Bt407]EEM31921.1 hypothetical protein bthur0003_55760 [Bacillus thuringiensis serovar thuringiensis str. T01001]EEM63044.1 hypothetical protein bthur0008_53590 [Bacillus thuringiensis serovar berliner ATCC 10792]
MKMKLLIDVYYCESCEEEFAVNKDREVVCCPHCESQDIEKSYTGSHSRI